VEPAWRPTASGPFLAALHCTALHCTAQARHCTALHRTWLGRKCQSLPPRAEDGTPDRSPARRPPLLLPRPPQVLSPHFSLCKACCKVVAARPQQHIFRFEPLSALLLLSVPGGPGRQGGRRLLLRLKPQMKTQMRTSRWTQLSLRKMPM
jgi:hypothetical protein